MTSRRWPKILSHAELADQHQPAVRGLQQRRQALPVGLFLQLELASAVAADQQGAGQPGEEHGAVVENQPPGQHRLGVRIELAPALSGVLRTV
jgi:hypothetical protein